MRKLTILVDLDDTIEGLLQAWVDCLNERYGTHVNRDDVVEWDVSAFFPEIPSRLVYAPLLEEGFWENVKPFEGAAEYLQKLRDEGHRIMIVTASNYKALQYKMDKVLFRYFPMFTWSDVIVTSYKQMIKGDVLVDDGVHNLIGGSYEKLLMDAPHNRDFPEHMYGMTRVNNWEEVYREISRISKG